MAPTKIIVESANRMMTMQLFCGDTAISDKILFYHQADLQGILAVIKVMTGFRYGLKKEFGKTRIFERVE